MSIQLLGEKLLSTKNRLFIRSTLFDAFEYISFYEDFFCDRMNGIIELNAQFHCFIWLSPSPTIYLLFRLW